MRGVRLNTDAIDNSAGVNTSDVEVNIKIALSAADARRPAHARSAQQAARRDDRRGGAARAAQQLPADAGALAGAAARAGGPRLPAAPDADAGDSAACSTARSSTCPTTWSSPSGASAGRALTRPELAVLLAYAKLSLYGDLLESSVPDDPYLGRELVALFPEPAGRALSATRSEQHRLRREIIATQLTNSMINRGGPSFVVRIADQTGASAADDRGRVLRGARQLRHDRAQQRDRCARQQDRRQAAARSLRGGRGPAARPHRLVPAQRRCLEGARRRRRALSRRHRAGGGRARTTCCRRMRRASLAARATELDRTPACRKTSRAASRSLPALAAAPDIVLVADRTGKPVAGCRGDLFRGRRVLPARPHRQRGARHPGHRLFRPARARPRARLDRRGGAAAHRRDGRRTA